MHSPGADELGEALNQVRMIRFGMEAIWSALDSLPDGATPDDMSVRKALQTISDWLGQVEEGELHDKVLTRNYTVIRPVSLVSPPSAESLAEITAAIGVLNMHALVIASDA
jgi:hypothetical protein